MGEWAQALYNYKAINENNQELLFFGNIMTGGIRRQTDTKINRFVD